MDLRAIVRARAVEQHGGEKGAIAALARRVAPAWGLMPDRAAERLSRFLNGHGAMGADALVIVLVALDLDVVPRANVSSHSATWYTSKTAGDA